MSATAVGGAKQNSLPMNPSPQLLTPCPWTVHPLEEGAGLFAVALGAWGLGAVTPDCGPWYVAFGSMVPLGVPKQGTCIVFEVG